MGRPGRRKWTAEQKERIVEEARAAWRFGIGGGQALSKTSRASLAAAVRAQPEMADRLIELAAAELARAHEHMLLLGRKNAQEKVASLLLELARRVGMDEGRPPSDCQSRARRWPTISASPSRP